MEGKRKFIMSENIFRDALTNLTYDVASGDAIVHLAKQGYLLQEIKEMLDFPTSYERVQESFWKYLVAEKIIVEEKSELGKRREKVNFVTDYDSYGHKSLRRVVEYEDGGDSNVDDFLKSTYTPVADGDFADFIKELYESETYVSCDFGVRKGNAFGVLSDREKLYMEGIPWKRKLVWHRIDKRMLKILPVLYEQAAYHGVLVSLKKENQISF
jgi:hypothetical protein